jgi:hypothetical protein
VSAGRRSIRRIACCGGFARLGYQSAGSFVDRGGAQQEYRVENAAIPDGLLDGSASVR